MKASKKLCYLLIGFVIFGGCQQYQPQPSQMSNPTNQSAKYPHLYGSGEHLYMSWISEKDTTHTLNYARYSSGHWSTPAVIAESSSWFVNWADYPSIIGNDKPIAAHWLNKIPGGTYAYNIQISTTDSSEQWQPPFSPHNDGTATEHGFVSMIPWDDDTILAVWLDGRRSANRSPDEYYDISKAMTLRGALIATDGTVQRTFLIDEAVCDCCPTSLVKTDSGAVVAYRNRTDDEIRDIYLSRFDGTTWTDPASVHNDSWKIGACPVNGPKLAAADSTVLLAWHTEVNKSPTAKAVISQDYGASFGSPITLNKAPSLGRVDAALHGEKAYVSWLEKSKNHADTAKLQLGSFGIADTAVTTQTIDKLNSSRQTGFPQMESVGDTLIFAWTHVDSATTGITTKKMQLR
ncbi:MAG: hypothetical protein U5J63_00310 [Fodinibius sp.]|nr:hypothetical protein [Fodinibius sp.]